jgi:hypothetical protein
LSKFDNFCGPYRTSSTNVTKYVLLISSCFSHFPVRSSSMKVVFKILKILKIVFGSAVLVLLMLQSLFCSIPTISLLFRSGVRLVGWSGGRAAGEIENKTNSVQFQMKLPTGFELGNNLLFISCDIEVMKPCLI